MITAIELEVLQHTSRTGRYVTNCPAIIEMAEHGLLRDYGPQALAGGDHYLTLTSKGRFLLNWHFANLCRFPEPKRKRPASEQFMAWRQYVDACQRISFPSFLKEVWPHRHAW